MRRINLGFLRTPQSEPLAAALAMTTGCVISTAQVTGLTGAEIAAECLETNIDFLVLGSQDPVPAMAAKAGIPVLVRRYGQWLRADFSHKGSISFSPWAGLDGYVPFALRAPVADWPEATVLSGELTPEQVLAAVQGQDSILLLPEPIPSIYDAQNNGVRCIAFGPTGEIIEVFVTVNEDPFEIQIVTKPFVL